MSTDINFNSTNELSYMETLHLVLEEMKSLKRDNAHVGGITWLIDGLSPEYDLKPKATLNSWAKGDGGIEAHLEIFQLSKAEAEVVTKEIKHRLKLLKEDA
jgi:hypothetical protein